MSLVPDSSMNERHAELSASPVDDDVPVALRQWKGGYEQAVPSVDRAIGNARNSFHAALGLTLRMLRGEKDWSQIEFAQAAGLHANQIGQFERCEVSPSVESLRALTKALGLPVSALFLRVESYHRHLLALRTLPPRQRPPQP